jgi:acid phosphatase
MRRPVRLLAVLSLLLATLTAAGGLALARGTTTTDTTAGGTVVSVRAGFYYPWFPETWHPTDHYHPSQGDYSSDDAGVVDGQFAAMHYAGMDAAISSWWGQGQHHEQTRFPLEMSAAAAHGMAVTPYYEKEGTGDTPLAQIRDDLHYLGSYADADPTGFLHVDGKPVLFVYNAAPSTSTCADVAKWSRATHGFADWYVSMKVFPGYASCADQPQAWHQYGPATARHDFAPSSYTVSPGFWKYDETSPRLARDLSRFTSDVAAMKASGAQWQLVTTFNEWGEGTAVESATEWASASGYGSYLDALHDAYASGSSTVSAEPSPTDPASSASSPTDPASSPTDGTSPTSGPTTTSPTGPTVDTTLDATADSETDESAPSSTFGTAARLGVDGSPVRRAWYKFDLPGTPVSATLRVYAGSSSTDGFTVDTAPSTWTEDGLTADTAPALGTQVGAQDAITGRAYTDVPIDPTALGAGDNTLVVSRSNPVKVSFYSRESTHPPTLLVSYDAGTSVSPNPSPSPTSGTTPSPSPSPTPTPSPSQASPASGTVTKLLVFVEENHSLDEMKADMPYTFSLAQKYGYATGWKAITHPSLPNYLAMAGGSTYGVTDDNSPSSHPIPGSSIFGQALAAGKTAKTYAESMTSNCQQGSSGEYAVRHNPWAYYVASAERSGCTAHDVPFTAFAGDVSAGTLPSLGFVIPNLCDDAHDCSLATADSWFQARMSSVFAGPDWKSGHLAVVLTADEDDSSQANTVLTVVIHPSQNGHVVSTPLSHYSLTRLAEDVVGAPHQNGATTAGDPATAFGLPLG